jgi:hypothetical protein
MRIRAYMTVIGVALLGTIAVAQSVNYDYDRAANFSKFRTYAWIRGTVLQDDLNHARVVRAIDAQLASKGLSRVDGEREADVLVAYHANFDENVQITGFSTGYGLPRFGHASGTATAQKIVSGTLIVDLMDAKTRNVVWRGSAERDLDPSAKPDKRDKNINKATEKIFKNYPPKS